MKIIYIAHPISGDINENLADLRRIIRRMNLEYPDVVPFCPYYADIVSLDDNVPEERERGRRNDTAVLKSGMVNEVWLTGTRISFGMQAEAELATVMGIPVIDKTNQL